MVRFANPPPTIPLTIRCSPELKDGIRARAMELKMTISDLVRPLLEQALLVCPYCGARKRASR